MPTGSIRVIVADTGKPAYLPANLTEIRNGHAIIPLELKIRIIGAHESKRYETA